MCGAVVIREGLAWADRAMGAAGDLPAQWRLGNLFDLRAVAYVRTGDIETAKRVATDLDDRYPFATWRDHGPDDPGSLEAQGSGPRAASMPWGSGNRATTLIPMRTSAWLPMMSCTRDLEATFRPIP